MIPATQGSRSKLRLNKIRRLLVKKFVYFIEDNFDTYDWLARYYRQYYWTTRGEIAMTISK
jgi:hypothetical protein